MLLKLLKLQPKLLEARQNPKNEKFWTFCKHNQTFPPFSEPKREFLNDQAIFSIDYRRKWCRLFLSPQINTPALIPSWFQSSNTNKAQNKLEACRSDKIFLIKCKIDYIQGCSSSAYCNASSFIDMFVCFQTTQTTDTLSNELEINAKKSCVRRQLWNTETSGLDFMKWKTFLKLLFYGNFRFCIRQIKVMNKTVF